MADDRRREAASLYGEVMAGGAADPPVLASVTMPYRDDHGARDNLCRALSASLTGLKCSLDRVRYADVRIEGYLLRDRSGSASISVAFRMPASSLTAHAQRGGTPALVDEGGRRDGKQTEWLPLRHEDFLDIVENPWGGNDVEAWYGDLPDSRSDGDGASASRSDPGHAATWRSERIPLAAGPGRRVMTVRIDVDDLHDTSGASAEADDRIVGTALLRLYGTLVGVGMSQADRDEIDQGVTPLLAWKDDQRTVHIRFSAKGRFANAWATPQMAISPAAAHVIIPENAIVVRSGELATWHRMVLDTLLPFRAAEPPRDLKPLWIVTASFMIATCFAGRFLTDVVGVPMAIAAVLIGMTIIGGLAVLAANPPKRRDDDRTDTPEAVCMELRAIARNHLPLTEAQRVGDAANACLRFLAMTDGSTDQAAIDAAVLIRRHLPVLLERYRDAVRVAQPNEIAQQASRLCQGVVDLGTLADDVRLGMLKAAGDALDVELRYVRSRISDPVLSPITDRVA